MYIFKETLVFTNIFFYGLYARKNLYCRKVVAVKNLHLELKIFIHFFFFLLNLYKLQEEENTTGLKFDESKKKIRAIWIKAGKVRKKKIN